METSPIAPEPPPTPPAPNWREQKARFKEHLNALARQVEQQGADEQFRAYLAGYARFWRYSFWNYHFIRWACPLATSVRGQREWESAGRSIKPGAKGIAILAPGRHWPAGGFKSLAFCRNRKVKRAGRR